MRNFLLILILTLSFQSWTKADDIRDFQIEGMSVGDSLLSIATIMEINKARALNQYPNDKFIIYNLDKLKSLKNYDWMTVTAKKDDKSYILTNISGALSYEKLDDCLKLKKNIQIDIENIFIDNQKQDVDYASKQDKTGDSKVIGVQYYLKPYPSNEAISVNCYHMTKKSNLKRVLKVAVNSEEFAFFLINEAY